MLILQIGQQQPVVDLHDWSQVETGDQDPVYEVPGLNEFVAELKAGLKSLFDPNKRADLNQLNFYFWLLQAGLRCEIFGLFLLSFSQIQTKMY